MNDAKKKTQIPARRGGLGRGLGALIPSGPLPGGSSGKGHFWNALDNPPAVDDEAVNSLITGAPADRSDADSGERPDKSPGQQDDSDVSSVGTSESGSRDVRGTAVDIHVDTPTGSGTAGVTADADGPADSGGEIEAADEPSDPVTADSRVTDVASGANHDEPAPGEDSESRVSRETTDPEKSPETFSHREVSRETSSVDSSPETSVHDVSRETATDELASSDRHSVIDSAIDSATDGATDSEADGATDGATDSDGRAEGERSAPAAVLVELDPDAIRANPKNPRQVFDDDELAELSASIKEFGLLQPIVVRERPDGYELVMGERRLRASKLAGVEAIPVIVRQTEDDEMLRDALLENIHRVQLHPLEEAAAYQQLIDEFGVTHDELAQRIKRSRPVISNTIRLLKLPARVQNRVAAGVISGSHARALLSLDDTEAQEALATRIVAEGMSVRATEEAVSLYSSDGAGSKRAVRRKRPTAPALGALAEKLSDHFDTRALVQLGRSKGKIVVEFASIDDLERIIAMMAPPLATQQLNVNGSGGNGGSASGAGTNPEAGADPGEESPAPGW